MKTIAERETQLRARLAELDTHLHTIEDALEETPNKDVEERAVERESDEVLESLGNAELLEFRMIEAALVRITEGEYGYCADCGDKITEERLDILPATPKCRKCAA
ncbi:dimethylmenaquinone methyltransferase [Rhodobacterales bacterium 52_120_T64]|nr:dimethylmenaquinone methyltransferase [Rhodobacterales bacterium 52_120_T64]